MKTKFKKITMVGLTALFAGSLSVAQSDLPQVEEASNSWTSSPSAAQATSSNQSVSNNASSSNFTVSQDPTLDMAQRLSIVEQSLNNFNQMNFPGQITQLEQEIQQLRGQVEVLEHKLHRLQTQHKQAAANLSLTSAGQNNQQPGVGSQGQGEDQNLGGSDDLDSSGVSAGTSSSQAPAAPLAVNPNLTPKEQEKRTYDAAFSLVQAHAYDDAIAAFQGYQKIFGDNGRYAANSYYWLGELYAHQQKYDQAKAALLKIVNNYPDSNKTADAMLKLGIIEQKQGDQEKANEWLIKVVKGYPNTSTARLAKNYLHG